MIPVVNHWYLNVSLPLHKTERVRVVSVSAGTVTFTMLPHPGDPEVPIRRSLDTFCKLFRSCEELSHARLLAACPSTCPTCFSAKMNRVVQRIIDRADAEHARKERARRREQIRRAAIRQLEPRTPTRKAR